MIVKNCTVSTEYTYDTLRADEPFGFNMKRYFIKIEIPLPGVEQFMNFHLLQN